MSVIPSFNKKLLQYSTQSTALLALVLGSCVALTACSGDDHHEVSAVDKVDEAAEMAIENSPEPIDYEIEESTVDATTADAEMTTVENEADAAVEQAEDSSAEPVSEQSTAEQDTSADTTQEGGAAPMLASDAGKQLYEKACKDCHATGLLNAPKLGDTEAWKARVAEKDKATLVKHSAEGFNQMPAQAVNGVTVEQIEAAVDYMIEQST